MEGLNAPVSCPQESSSSAGEIREVSLRQQSIVDPFFLGQIALPYCEARQQFRCWCLCVVGCSSLAVIAEFRKQFGADIDVESEPCHLDFVDGFYETSQYLSDSSGIRIACDFQNFNRGFEDSAPVHLLNLTPHLDLLDMIR